MAMQERMRSQLQRQLGYLQRSARLFDLGYLDEGVRIATCLRVLFHDRPRDPLTQGSIYKQLGRPRLSMRTTVEPRSFGPGVFAFDGYCHLPGNMLPWGEYLKGDLHLLEVDGWWSQVIFVVDRNQVTRRQLALWAAEKDGGAHTDAQLHPGYEALFRMWLSVPTESSQSTSTAVPHQHLFALRRFALEVLASDELLNIAWPDGQRPESRVIADWPEDWSPVMDKVYDIASIYFANLPKVREHRDGEAIGKALHLVDDIRMPLSEWRADHLTRTSQYSAALSGYAAIQAIRPGHQHSLYGLGYVSHRLALHSEAESHLKAALANDPSHLPSQIALADLYLHDDRFEMARPLYEKVLELDPANSSAMINLEILALSERALIPEKAVSALIELGRVYLSFGLNAGAIETFERVLRLDPENATASLEMQRIVEQGTGNGPCAT